jgi:3-oxoacyl-[acyl-carrier protein] reductase
MTTPTELPANGSFSFAGRTALVTGGGRGVGAAVAREIHAGGGKVAVSDMDLAAAQEVALALDPSGETAIAIALDVRSKDDFLAARDRVVEAWGKIDIVVNNAGLARRTPTQDISPEEFDEIVAINMRSVFLSCQIFSEHMRANGYGRIVNVTSLAGQNGGTVASPHYAASKAGAIMLSKYFARYLAGTGVTVNAIAPGPIDTAKARLSPEQIARVEGEVPIGRFMEVGEIAAAVALVASDRGGFFVGATLDMNGGLYLR